MHVTLCDFIELWESTTATQKKSLTQRYDMGCDCKVERRSGRWFSNVWAPRALTDAFLRSSDHSLHLHPLPDQRPLGVPVDGLGDGESRVRTAGPTLRLHQEERRLVCLVQRGGTTQKGLHGHRRSLTALLSNLPRYQKTHFFLLVSVSAKHALSGAFLFAGLLVCFCACVLFLLNALMNPALSTLCTHKSTALRHKPLLSDLIKGCLSHFNLPSSFRPSFQPCSCSLDSFLVRICKTFPLLCS